MKKKSNITFIILSGNEEKRIEYPIKCFLPYGEVIIFLDEESTDKTASIAKKLGAKVIKRPRMEQDFGETKEMSDFVCQFVKTDWLFWGYVDIMIAKPCLELYKKISQESKYKVVVQKKKTLLFEPSTEYFPCYAAINFFRKDSIDFTNNIIHQMGKFAPHVKPSEILYLPPIDEYSIYHFSTSTIHSLLKHFASYTRIHALSSCPRFLRLRIIFQPLFAFIIHYLFNGAFRYGIQGLIVSVQYSYYPFLLYSQVYEKSNNLNPDSVEKKFAKIKRELLDTSPKSRWWQKLMAKLKMAVVTRIYALYKFRICRQKIKCQKSYR